MSKFISLKLTDETGYWVIDLERGTVSKADAENTATVGSSPGFSGVEFAVVSEMRDDAFSGKFDK